MEKLLFYEAYITWKSKKFILFIRTWHNQFVNFTYCIYYRNRKSVKLLLCRQISLNLIEFQFQAKTFYSTIFHIPTSVSNHICVQQTYEEQNETVTHIYLHFWLKWITHTKILMRFFILFSSSFTHLFNLRNYFNCIRVFGYIIMHCIYNILKLLGFISKSCEMYSCLCCFVYI